MHATDYLQQLSLALADLQGGIAQMQRGAAPVELGLIADAARELALVVELALTRSQPTALTHATAALDASVFAYARTARGICDAYADELWGLLSDADRDELDAAGKAWSTASQEMLAAARAVAREGEP